MNKWIAEFDLEDDDTMPEHMDLEYKGVKLDFHCRPLEQEPTTKNDLGVREFEEIVVEYPPEDLCTYPEYKGKPYFGIKYKEGNDYIIGYGTYSPKVLSRYLTDYFMSSVTPQEPRCKDCKWWKDSDGEYRRGCGAESQCPINRREVFEGNGYCFLFEPQESGG